MDYDRLSAEFEAVWSAFSVEDILYIIWSDVHLVLSAFDQHVELGREFLDFCILAVKDDVKTACNYFQIRKVTAQCLKVLVCCSVDFNRVDCFKMNCLSAHYFSFLLFRFFLPRVCRSQPFCHIPICRAILRGCREIPLQEGLCMIRSILPVLNSKDR